jgi:hypothetical protein
MPYTFNPFTGNLDYYSSSGPSGFAEWGEINGDIENQLDLINALGNKQDNLGFTPENISNKTTDFTTINDTKYPTVKAVKDHTDSLATNWGDIGGTLSNQTDLQTALNSKLDTVSEDTAPLLGGDLDLNGKALMQVGVAGEAITAGNLCTCYSGKWYKADNTSPSLRSTSVKLGIAKTSITTNNSGYFYVFGPVVMTGLTSGSTYVMGASGAITTTAPTGTTNIVRIIGQAESTTELYFTPFFPWMELV